MMRHLTCLVLSGILGSIVLVGEAQACHKRRCACTMPVVCVAPAPVVCARPVARVKPVPCAQPTKICPQPTMACAPQPKKCGVGLLGGLCHKKRVVTVAYVMPVSCSYGYGAVAPSGQSMALPQASPQR
jgi:hypothetical protein